MNHAARTISYFTVWGTIYGLLTGLLVGSTAWLMGAYLGALLGSAAGCMLGIVIGIITVVIHKSVFHQDIDLTRYRRYLTVFNGSITVIVGLPLLMILITGFVNAASLGSRGTLIEADNHTLTVTILIKTVIMTVLCVAYISSHYPDWIVETFYTPHPQAHSYPVREAFMTLGKYFFKSPYVALSIGVAVCIYAVEMIQAADVVTSGDKMLPVLTMALVYPYLASFISLANAIFLTVLKRLLFDEGLIRVSTYHYKYLMTGISFFFTVFMTAWGLNLAPLQDVGFFNGVNTFHTMGKVASIVFGLLAAVHVYHTIALTNEDKTKRKATTHDSSPEQSLPIQGDIIL